MGGHRGAQSEEKNVRRILKWRPSPAMIIAIVALIAALAGTAFAAGFVKTTKFKKFKQNTNTSLSKTLQSLTYVSNTQTVPPSAGTNYTTVNAQCPSGLKPVGGGIKLTPSVSTIWWGDGYLNSAGYQGHVFNGTAANATAVTTVACVSATATGTP